MYRANFSNNSQRTAKKRGTDKAPTSKEAGKPSEGREGMRGTGTPAIAREKLKAEEGDQRTVRFYFIG
jgi:hypothetical protein